MRMENIVSLTQSALAQAMGKEYMEKLGNLADLPVSALVDVGTDVTDYAPTCERYSKALITQMLEMEIMNLNIADEFGDLFANKTEFLGYLERVYYDVAQFIDDPSWNLVAGQSYAELEHTFFEPKVQSKIFNELKAGMIPMSFQRETLAESFKSWEAVDSYLSTIQASVQQTLKLVKKAYSRMAVSAGIAMSYSPNCMNTAIHLLTNAIQAGIVEEGTTAEEALENPDFLSYCCREMDRIRSFMKVENKVFNNGSILSAADVVKTYVLKDFERAVRFNLRADTYNPEDRSLGDYSAITSWQGVADGGDKFTFDVLSTVKIAADPNNKLGIGTQALTIPHIIAFAFDERAIKYTIQKEHITSNVTSSADFYTQWLHLVLSLIVDSNLPMVTFVLD